MNDDPKEQPEKENKPTEKDESGIDQDFFAVNDTGSEVQRSLNPASSATTRYDPPLKNKANKGQEKGKTRNN